jgi:hypothetical protein
MTTSHAPHLGPVDLDALTRAMEIAKRNPVRAKHLEWEEQTYGWETAATSAAYGCQFDALKLRPWQEVPMHCDSTDGIDDFPNAGRAMAADLLRRLLAANLSRYEPDPHAALARAETVARIEREAVNPTSEA